MPQYAPRTILRHDFSPPLNDVPQTWSVNAGDRRGVPLEEDGLDRHNSERSSQRRDGMSPIATKDL
jgi:hypothetical protein